MSSPLGPYGSLVSAILAVGIVGAAVVSHVLPFLVPSPYLDSLAAAVVGVVFGVQIATNGSTAAANAAGASAAAAHARLDAMGAPAAADPARGVHP